MWFVCTLGKKFIHQPRNAGFLVHKISELASWEKWVLENYCALWIQPMKGGKLHNVFLTWHFEKNGNRIIFSCKWRMVILSARFSLFIRVWIWNCISCFEIHCFSLCLSKLHQVMIVRKLLSKNWLKENDFSKFECILCVESLYSVVCNPGLVHVFVTWICKSLFCDVRLHISSCLIMS